MVLPTISTALYAIQQPNFWLSIFSTETILYNNLVREYISVPFHSTDMKQDYNYDKIV